MHKAKNYLLLWFLVANLMLTAQTTETVSMGGGYANDVYYSLANGIVKTEARNNWHIAFTTQIVDAAIWVNEGLGVELYVASTDTGNFGSIDTSGLSWIALHNSPAGWDEGAFNDGANGHPDYGWGVYNNITHNVFGTKVYVMKLENGVYKQIMIRSMRTNGEFTFKIADLDGSNEVIRTANKNSYSAKNFFYYDVLNDQFVDREPNTADWDMLFTRYVEELSPGVYYPVSGVYINKDVSAAKAEGVDTATVDWNDYQRTDSITVIGSDWKIFNNGTFQWSMTDSLAYFVEGLDGQLYKLIFTDFGGSTTGDITFNKAIASAIGMEENALARTKIFPQPATDFLTLLVERETNVEIYSLTGALINELSIHPGENRVPVADLTPGVYVLRLSAEGQASATRIVIQ
jgi:hypothetical protein